MIVRSCMTRIFMSSLPWCLRVVAVDGAVDREESLEEQLVDVVELADPQPAPVNAS
uniref:Uncharacterized protein n=1 Tax=Parascaris equorum TaxID=6256 RepID=A0A914R445_PAREQ